MSENPVCGADPIWIMQSVESKDRPTAEYDHEVSSMPSADSISSTPFSGSDSAVFRLDVGVRRVETHDILSNTGSALLLRRRALAAIQELSPETVSTKLVEVRAKDGSINDFELVKPLVFVDCLDLELSDLTWLLPNRYIDKIKKLHFKPNCLENCEFARESTTKHMVIPDRLRRALDSIDREGYIPIRPEDFSS